MVKKERTERLSQHRSLLSHCPVSPKPALRFPSHSSYRLFKGLVSYLFEGYSDTDLGVFKH